MKKLKKSQLKALNELAIESQRLGFYDVNLFKNNHEFDAARKAANKELIKILTRYIKLNPNQRFSQVLRNLDFVQESDSSVLNSSWKNEFMLEPTTLLKRVQRNFKRDY